MRINNLTSKFKSKEWLRDHIAYFHEELFLLSESGFIVTDKPKKAIIVSRKHYSESWQTYSSLSLKELKELLKLQSTLKSNTILQTYYKNQQQEGFDVKTISFDQDVADKFKDSFLLPETELLSQNWLDVKTVAELETPAGTLFYTQVEGKTQSAYKKGLMTSVERFSLSVGVSNEVEKVLFKSDDYCKLLWKALSTLPLQKFPKIIAFDLQANLNYKALHSLYLAPIACAAIFILGLNAFYMYQESVLDNELNAQKEDVNQLLSKKQKIDIAKLYVEQVSNELSEYPSVHRNWELAYIATKEGMDIQQFTGSESKVMIRGFANSASKILTAMSNLPELSSAQFDGPVRKSGVRDYFIMQLQLVDKNEK